MEVRQLTSRRLIEVVALVGVAIVVLVADQLSKAAVAANLAVGAHANVVGDFVQVWHAQNYGASFSLFQGAQPLFLVVSVVAVAMIAYFFVALRGRSPWLFAILGLILGGTIGNFVDRVRHAYVIDFISVGFGGTRFPTFNIADSSLVVGILLIVVILWIFDRTDAPSVKPAPEADPARPLPGTSAGPGETPHSGGAR